MPSPTISAAVERAIGARRLLTHPFYRSWQDGTLTGSDLSAYAEQYRWFEAALPQVLTGVATSMDEGEARTLTERNLADELSSPEPHLRLFDRFAGAVGAEPDASPTAATGRLVGLYRQAVAEGPVSALAVIAAYETQAAEVAATKSDALRRHHGLTVEDTAFWDVHAELEQEHASWTLDGLVELGADSAEVEIWAERSAAAWWEFLDEREAARV